jgi:hypothetical protein
MLRVSRLLALVPLLGLAELALHQYFVERAPRFQDYAQLAPVLLALKRPGTPVVVAPHWAEPLVRQAAPSAFPIGELARADDSGFSSFLEVSLLGQSTAELAAFPVLRTQQVGPFRVSLHQNPKPEPISFDFVTAVERGQVQVFVEVDQQLSQCQRVEHAHATTGGLHGHVAYPRVRHECGGGRFVGVTLVEDEAYRPHRCILAEPPDGGSVVLRFSSVPASRRLVGFAGFSYFLERDVTADEVELEVNEGGAELGQYRVSGARGWSRFELARSAPGSVDIKLRRLLRKAGDVCFALEAR